MIFEELYSHCGRSITTGKTQKVCQINCTFEESSNEVMAACKHRLISSAAGRLVILNISLMSNLDN